MCFFSDALLKVKTEKKQQIKAIKLLNMLIGRIENREALLSTADHVTGALEQ